MSLKRGKFGLPTQKTTNDPLLLPPIYIVIPSTYTLPYYNKPKIFSVEPSPNIPPRSGVLEFLTYCQSSKFFYNFFGVKFYSNPLVEDWVVVPAKRGSNGRQVKGID